MPPIENSRGSKRAARNSSAQSQRKKCSTLRAVRFCPFGIAEGSILRSRTMHAIPALPSVAANPRPTGPPPTTMTEVWMRRLLDPTQLNRTARTILSQQSPVCRQSPCRRVRRGRRRRITLKRYGASGACRHVRRVDSATAAARAVDAGHEVTGVHLALSQNPQSYRSGARGCCTLEDARDARRAADVIGIPFYVWDMAERFKQDVVDDFVAEYTARRTPNPCCDATRRSSSPPCWTAPWRSVSTRCAPGTTPDRRRGALNRAADPGKDQSYVLAVLTRDQIAHAMFPLGDTPKAKVREEARDRGLLVADKPDSHDVCFIADGDTRGFLSRQLGSAPGKSSTRTARCSARMTAPTGSPRPAQGIAGRPAGS